MLAELDYAYLAGLFDGEGSIGYYQKGKDSRYRVRISISNNDPRIMLWLKDRIKYGAVHEHRNKQRKHKNWVWSVNGEKLAKDFLQTIKPYLIIKKDQVDLLFSFWDAEQIIKAGRREFLEDVINLRNETIIKLKDLKTASYIQSIH